MTSTQQLIPIGVVVLGTVLTRFLPYLVFREGKKIPPVVDYLGKVLPPAVFGLLVVYCLRNVNFFAGTHGIPEMVSLSVVLLLYLWRKNMLVPMAGGTICYMVLIRVLS